MTQSPPEGMARAYLFHGVAFVWSDGRFHAPGYASQREGTFRRMERQGRVHPIHPLDPSDPQPWAIAPEVDSESFRPLEGYTHWNVYGHGCERRSIDMGSLSPTESTIAIYRRHTIHGVDLLERVWVADGMSRPPCQECGERPAAPWDTAPGNYCSDVCAERACARETAPLATSIPREQYRDDPPEVVRVEWGSPNAVWLYSWDGWFESYGEGPSSRIEDLPGDLPVAVYHRQPDDTASLYWSRARGYAGNDPGMSLEQVESLTLRMAKEDPIRVPLDLVDWAAVHRGEVVPPMRVVPPKENCAGIPPGDVEWEVRMFAVDSEGDVLWPNFSDYEQRPTSDEAAHYTMTGHLIGYRTGDGWRDCTRKRVEKCSCCGVEEGNEHTPGCVMVPRDTTKGTQDEDGAEAPAVRRNGERDRPADCGLAEGQPRTMAAGGPRHVPAGYTGLDLQPQDDTWKARWAAEAQEFLKPRAFQVRDPKSDAAQAKRGKLAKVADRVAKEMKEK